MQLAQLSQLNSERGRAALAELLDRDPFLRFLEANSAWEEDATDFDWRPIDPSQALQTRAIGGEYIPTDATPGTRQTDTLSFHGFSIDIDETHIADANRGLRDLDQWLSKEITRRIRKWSKLFGNALFVGAGTTTLLKGLSKILDGTTDLPGYAGETGVIDAADWLTGTPDSFDLSNSANWGTFIEKLIRYRLSVPGAKGMAMSPELYARMYTIAQSKHILGEQRDAFGVPVATFAGLPMIEMIEGSILTTEPDNNVSPATNTTSLYLMRPGEMDLSLVSNSGLQFDDDIDLEKKESRRVKAEIRAKWKIEEKDSIRRFRNIKL